MFSSPQEFWEQNSEYQDRKFYVAFCLLESALSDYAVARDLHVHNKLNWACTTYYYSLVHALRLICFMTKGDFPRGHSDIAELFKKGAFKKQTWLEKDFSKHFQRVNVNVIKFSLQDVISALSSETPTEIEQKFRRWGEILDKARKLRNDSNYEGLIIAHEYAHVRVTEDLQSLADLFKKATEEILPEVIRFFKTFIDQHDRREYWYDFLNYQEKRKGLYYLEGMLRYKLLGESIMWFSRESRIANDTSEFDKNSGDRIMQNILEWVKPLRSAITTNEFAEEVLKNIKLGIFDEKRSLMQSFREDISSLRGIIERSPRGSAVY